MENNATASNNISSTIVENLTKVLSEELCQHMRHGGTEHKRLQKRIEAILCRFLEHQPAGHETLNFGNQILDLLLANYDWNEEKFEHEMEISEIETIIGEIRQLQREIAVEQQFNRQCPRQPTIQPDSSPDQTSLSIGKKSYADILIDRPFNIVETNRSGMEQENYLMNCLRYRLSYPDLNYNAAGGSNRGSNDKKISVMKTTVPEEPLAGSISLYDTLLRLIDEFDAAGVVEIFRLLKERRSAIPLFVPTSKKHHLHLMKHIFFNSFEELWMSQGDEKVTRVAVVSCYTDKSESLTSDLLKSLFHIDSVHFHDFNGGHITSENVTAEIGCGCLLTGEKSGQEKNIQHMMVVHVVGDFRPLWPFLAKFADYVLVEDGTEEKENFLAFLDKNPSILRDIIHASSEIKEGQVPFVSVWKSSRTQTNGIVELYDRDFRYYSIGNTSPSLLKTINYLRSVLSFAVQQSQSKSTRLPLHEISHTLEDAGYSPLMYSTPVDVQSAIANEEDNLSQMKREQFLLQKLYEEQAKHEEDWCDRRLEKSQKKAEAKIRRCQQKRRIRVLQTDLSSSGPKLLQLLLELLMNPEPCSRVLSLCVLEKKLTERNKYEQRSLLENIDKLERAYCEKATERNEAQDKDLLMKLNAARIELDEGVFGIEHLWRELSHYYTAVKSEHRSSLNAKIPQLAAQHLLDGFSMEFLDGDSNRLHLDWVTQVLREFEKLIGKQKRIFVLSVMGIQSSGKSTLLYTMFGIQMRTGIGQSTRGVNMQLLKVEDRAEYDYILLLDTEGCRAPEFQGLPAGRKRDNQMATLSVLLADATIVAINGVDVSAIREILPIVLIAYQGSRLAENNDGRRSSRMFFVYNRINTKDDDKVHSIIINFKMSLAEAFRQLSSGVTSVAGSRTESLNLQGTTQTSFTNFKLTVPNFKNSSSESNNSDFCILGNVQKDIVPPNDVPDPDFGKSLVENRERIHRRVVGVSENGLATWRGRSIDEFCQYVELVWKCICSADLTVTFASVIERITLDKMDYEYKIIEQDLTMAYRKVYDTLKNEMIGRNPKIGSTGGDVDARLQVYKNQLKARIAPDIHSLNGRVAVMVKGEGHDKWKDAYGKMWKAC